MNALQETGSRNERHSIRSGGTKVAAINARPIRPMVPQIARSACRKRSLFVIDPRTLYLAHDLSKSAPFTFRKFLYQSGLCGSLIGSGEERQSIGKIAGFCLPLQHNGPRNRLCAEYRCRHTFPPEKREPRRPAMSPTGD